MKRFAAKEAKNGFGRLLDTAQREPVTIERQGRPVAVVLSIEDYERLEKAEDAFWIARAERAEAEGYIGVKRSEKAIKDLLDAED